MNKKHISVLLEGHENIADEGVNLLKAKGYKVFFPKSAQHILSDSDYYLSDALLVRGAVIDKNLIKNMKNLNVIARCGVGVDNIDTKAAREKGVPVCNVPEANFISVAEHVLGLLVSLSHHIVNGDRYIRTGRFDVRHHYIGTDLSGKIIGIIGFGRIGQLVAEKCIYGFDMNVLVYDPYVKEIDMANVQKTETADEIFKKADFITLHLPYTNELHHFINRNVLKKMKQTAYIINCARGGLIDEIALAEEIKKGNIGGAGLDVFQNEPPEENHPLWDVENIIATPHMGASTNESLERMATGAAKEVIRVLEGDSPIHLVN